MDSLTAAQDKTRTMNVPVVYLYSDESADCGPAGSATLDAIQELKGKVLIIDISRNESAKIPWNIPKTVAVNSRTGRTEKVIPCITDRKQRLAGIRKTGGLMRKWQRLPGDLRLVTDCLYMHVAYCAGQSFTDRLTLSAAQGTLPLSIRCGRHLR